MWKIDHNVAAADKPPKIKPTLPLRLAFIGIHHIRDSKIHGGAKDRLGRRCQSQSFRPQSRGWSLTEESESDTSNSDLVE